MLRITKNQTLFFLFLTTLLFFFVKGLLFLDPDFGWHIAMGRLILAHGIPSHDPFSYTMPSFPFIDQEWLTNIILFFFFKHLGYVFLSILFAIIALLSLTIMIKTWYPWTIPLFLLSAATLQQANGIRPQVESWLFFSILVAILLNKELWQKWKFSLPMIFLFWVNLHASFSFGIAIFFLVIVCNTISTRRIHKDEIIIFLASLLVSTFLNPYSYNIWAEIWRQGSDIRLHFTISEWFPAISYPLFISLWFFTPFSFFAVIKYYKKFSLAQLTLYVFCFLFGIASIRNIEFWLLLALSMTNTAFLYLWQDLKTIKGALSRYQILLKIFLISSFFISIIFMGIFLEESYGVSLNTAYPIAAVAYLHSHLPNGNIFSEYNWGGYLDLYLPKKKVFIDGRMPSWNWKAPNNQESDDVFSEYLDIITKKSALAYPVKKYHIHTLLIGTQTFNILKIELKEIGARRIYKDTIASIYSIP